MVIMTLVYLQPVENRLVFEANDETTCRSGYMSRSCWIFQHGTAVRHFSTN